MSVATRYVNRELLAVFVVTLLLLLLVGVGGRFIGYLQEAAMGKFTGATVMTIMYMRLPEFLQLVAPFALYVAILLTSGRLFADQEMVVFQGAGAGVGRLLAWISPTVLLVVGFVAMLAILVTPAANRSLDQFLTEARAQTEFETINPGAFHAYDRGRRVTYSESMSDDRRTLQQVFMSQRLENGGQVTLWAEEGTQYVDAVTGVHYLVLRNGRRYEVNNGRSDVRMMEFDQLRQKLDVYERAGAGFDVEAQYTAALSQTAPARAEWHWRIGMPIFCAVGALLALGISRVKPRDGRFARVVPGMLLMMTYYLVLLINRNALEEAQLPAVFGLWIVHGLFAAVALWLLSRLAHPVKQ